MAKKLIDPVAGEGKPYNEAMVSLEDFEFKPIPQKAARIKRPFDGYPMKRVQIGEANVFHTFVVALNPTVPVRQDPANKKVKQKDGTFKQVLSYHNRMVRDYENRENISIVFDRTIRIKGVDYYCAIIPSSNVRAQVCFKYDNKTKRIMVDERYLLLDGEQVQRLRQVYEQVINPKLKLEREAAFISGESNEAAEETTLTENEV